MSDCFICAKHRDIEAIPGGQIAGDQHCAVSHLPLVTPNGVAESVYLGHLIVEPRRHLAELGALTPAEASSFGQLMALASAGLQIATGAEHVYATVIGHGVEHLPLHLIPRYAGTPPEFWWKRVDEWPDAPRGHAAEIAELARRIRAAMVSTA